MQNISTRVLAVRRRLQLSQKELAKRMLYGRHYVSMLERGAATNPSPRFIEQIEMLERQIEIDDQSSSFRSEPLNMPPHQEMASSCVREDPPATGSEFDFAKCIKWLSELHDRHPEAFRSAAAMIKGLYESQKK